MLAHTPPLTTLTHVAVGETRVVGGRGEIFDSWHPAGLASPPTTPEEGEARWRAWRVDHHTVELLHPPTPVEEGGQVAGWVSGCLRGDPSWTKVSSELNES